MNSPSVLDLTDHIRCQIETAPQFETLKDDGYVAQITLSLKVEDNGGLSPNLSFITGAGFKGTFNYAIDGNANLDREQIYSTSYVLDLNAMSASDDPNCPVTEEGVTRSLSGGLEISNIVAAGIGEISRDKFNLAIKPPGGEFDKTSQYPNFGSTVQFMVTLGFDTGPSWTLVDFKGPSGSKGILSAGRISTDNLIIAFASAPRTTQVEELEKELEAAKEKQKEAIEEARKQGGIKELELSPEVQTANARVTRLSRDLEAAQATEAQTQASAGAISNAQNFTNAIILQNLAGSLH